MTRRLNKVGGCKHCTLNAYTHAKVQAELDHEFEHQDPIDLALATGVYDSCAQPDMLSPFCETPTYRLRQHQRLVAMTAAMLSEIERLRKELK